MVAGGIFFLFCNLKMFVFYTCSQQRLSRLVEHGLQKSYLFSAFFRITLLFKILLLLIISLRFLFLLYAVIGLSLNAFFNLVLICNKC